MTASTILLQLAAIGWGVLCGGVVYEHLAIVPQWASRPPASLTMWSGPYRVKAERFWMGIHPTLILLLAASLATGWNHAGRDAVIVVLGAYLAVLAVTATWFVPELMRLTHDPSASIPPDEWRTRARRWERLSIARGVLLVALAWPLLGALAGSSAN
jgi:hypothetical protein